MNCDEFVEEVTDFLDGALDAEQQGRFVDHLAECDGCEAYLGQLRRTIESLDDLPAVERLPEDARARLLDAFRNAAGSAKRPAH